MPSSTDLSSKRRALLLAALAAPLAAFGSEAAAVRWSDITLIDGTVLRAEQLQSSTVVATIWASWCPFCGAQNPHLQKLHDEYRQRGLLVVAFSIDKTVQAARDYAVKRGYTFPIAMATAQVDQWFGRRRTVPETYVIDRKGRIVVTHRGEMFPEDIAALARFAT